MNEEKAPGIYEKMQASAVNVKFISFHANTDFHGTGISKTTLTPDGTVKSIKYHAQSGMIMVDIKGRSFLTPTTGVKAMELDFGA